jgi:hypothetical protein
MRIGVEGREGKLGVTLSNLTPLLEDYDARGFIACSRLDVIT